jgi:hypothetical protein
MPTELYSSPLLEIRNCGYGMYGKRGPHMKCRDTVERRTAERFGWVNTIELLQQDSPR